MVLNSIPKRSLYFSFTISLIIFTILNFGLGETNLFGISDSILNLTKYYFGVGISTPDYLVIASFPIFGIVLNSKRKKHDFFNIIFDNIIILICSLFTFILGLLILTQIGNPKNPLIPQYLLVEPFKMYSTFFISCGIIIPFFLKKKEIEENEIENIGIIKNECKTSV